METISDVLITKYMLLDTYTVVLLGLAVQPLEQQDVQRHSPLPHPHQAKKIIKNHYKTRKLHKKEGRLPVESM